MTSSSQSDGLSQGYVSWRLLLYPVVLLAADVPAADADDVAAPAFDLDALV